VEGKDGTGMNLLGKGFRFLRKDVAIFAFFLLLSFFFWYLNSLRKDIEEDLKYPVRYVFSQNSRISDTDLPQKLLFNLKGPGYSIIKLKLSGNRSPLIIDFTRTPLKRVPDSSPAEYYFTTSALIPHFSKQLRSEFQILSVKPDTIFVSLEKKGSTAGGSRSSAAPGEKRRN